MRRQKWTENKNLWLKSGACVLFGISIAGSVLLKKREEKIEEDLKEIAKEQLNNRLNDLKKQLGYQELDYQLSLNDFKIVDKEHNQWLVKLNYDVVIISELAKMYSTKTWMMRVRQVNLKLYEVTEQGEQLNNF